MRGRERKKERKGRSIEHDQHTAQDDRPPREGGMRGRLTKVLGLDVLGVRYMILDRRVDGIELSPRLWVQKHVERLGDTLEERIVVGSGRGTGLLVRVVTQDFTTMGDSDVVLGGEVTEIA